MKERYEGLDLARAIFMILGIVFHSAGFYTLGGRSPGSSLAIYPEQSAFFDILTWFLHSFRMDAFYLLSGFFFALLVSRKGFKEAFRNRTFKILIPLFSVGMFLNWIIVYHQNLDTDFTFISFIKFFVSDGNWLRHLWFIGNLFGYYLTTILFFKLISKTFSPSKIKFLTVSLVLTPLSVLVISRVSEKLYSETILIFSFGRGIYEFFPYYLLGIYMWIHRDVVFSYFNLRNSLVILIASILMLCISKFSIKDNIPWIFYEAIYFAGSCFLAIGTTLLFKIIGEIPRSFTRKVVQASYTIYLFHMPLNLIFFYYIQLNFGLNIYLSYILQCILLFFSSYLIHYQLISKNDYLSLLFNGKEIKGGESIKAKSGIVYN